MAGQGGRGVPSFADEQVHRYGAGGELRYVYQPATTHPDRLVVGFSAFPPLDKPPRYYSVKVIEAAGCHKLFILDDAGPRMPHPRGCYYLGHNRDMAVAAAVDAFLGETVEKLGLEPSQVITCGSSKGGSAALLFAARNGFGRVICAEPQYSIGSYLVRASPAGHSNHEVARYIAGGTDDESVVWLDSVLPDAVAEADPATVVHLLAGSLGRYPREHGNPLRSALEARGLTVHVELAEFVRHTDLVLHFPEFMQRVLAASLGREGHAGQD